MSRFHEVLLVAVTLSAGWSGAEASLDPEPTQEEEPRTPEEDGPTTESDERSRGTGSGGPSAGDSEEEPAQQSRLPTSLFTLELDLTDQTGQRRRLDDFSGRPLVAAMIDTSCAAGCPTMIRDVKAMVGSFDRSGEPADLRVLLVSMDSERDTPEALRAFAALHSLDERYVLARTDEARARQIAELLGTDYHRSASGEIAHDEVVGLFDAQGQLAGRMQGFGAQRGDMVERLRQLLE